ncbi:MAG: sulfite exporter TauE/SafE family protein, partial [Sedimentisphaerales bacterium]|nr:sulfite exporter TauE/SafE family protein [Sedimentisphaerales bacterium]
FLSIKPNFRLAKNNRNMVTGGALSGFFAGIFGVGGAVRSTFLTAFDLPKAMYIATAGAIALLIDSARIITYIKGGTRLESKLLYGMLIFIPVSFLGARIAKKIVDYIPQRSFRLFITIFLALVGLYFLIFK